VPYNLSWLTAKTKIIDSVALKDHNLLISIQLVEYLVFINAVINLEICYTNLKTSHLFLGIVQYLLVHKMPCFNMIWTELCNLIRKLFLHGSN
jgi:hypothetical protein